MPLWLPSWWAADLDHFQEFPVPPSNTSEQYFGQDEEDRHVVEHYFAGKQHGTYLEVCPSLTQQRDVLSWTIGNVPLLLSKSTVLKLRRTCRNYVPC